MTWLRDRSGNPVRSDCIIILYVGESERESEILGGKQKVYGVVGQTTIPNIQVVFSDHPTKEEAEDARNKLLVQLSANAPQPGRLSLFKH